MKLISRIGAGAAGEVFLAKYKKMEVAVKFFGRGIVHISKDEMKISDDFEKEGNILGELNHKNIIHIYGAICEPPTFALVMEYLPQGNLNDYITSNPSLPYRKKVCMLKELAIGLQYIHNKNIMHRDLKMENILVADDGTIKIADFGLSKLISRDGVKKHTQMIGTSYYRAPEIIKSGEYSTKADIFSLSMIMYSLLTEHLQPFDTHSKGSVEFKVANDPKFRPIIPRLIYKRKQYGPYIDIMKRSWHEDPKERPPIEELLEFFTKECERPKRPKRPSKKKRPTAKQLFELEPKLTPSLRPKAFSERVRPPTKKVPIPRRKSMIKEGRRKIDIPKEHREKLKDILIRQQEEMEKMKRTK